MNAHIVANKARRAFRIVVKIGDLLVAVNSHLRQPLIASAEMNAPSRNPNQNAPTTKIATW